MQVIHGNTRSFLYMNYARDADFGDKRQIFSVDGCARACDATGRISACGLKGIGNDPHSGQSKAIFSAHLNRQDCSDSYSRVVRSLIPHFLGWLSSPRLPYHQ
jgi:hypothetical protein